MATHYNWPPTTRLNKNIISKSNILKTFIKFTILRKLKLKFLSLESPTRQNVNMSFRNLKF